MFKAYLLNFAAVSGLLSGALLAQSPLSFEVASIKPVGKIDPEAILSGKQKPGVFVDRSVAHFASLSLMELVCQAYSLGRNRVAGGPAWLWEGHPGTFDVMAKMPEGSTRQQVPEMLRTLLAERFNLVVHYEKRELPAYALILSRGGETLKQAAPDLGMPEGEEPRTIPGKKGRMR